MTYKALAIDLDGTLLVGEEVPLANIRAIRAARDAGYRIIIATARWKEMALRVAETLQVDGPVIACSGAQVFDPVTGTDVFSERLPEEFTRELYTICNQERCIATVTVSDRVLLKLDGQPDLSAMGDEMAWVKELEHDPLDLPRVGAIQGTAANARIKAELQEAYNNTINIFDSIGPTGKIIITITSKAATKGAALQAACSHLDLKPEEVVAFGDAENDLAMFSVAGAAVAMGQADNVVKAAADFVSTPNTEAGVGHAVEHLLTHGSF
jgi:Cof subfamily protein (haloacid dehalogenase superfamily)